MKKLLSVSGLILLLLAGCQGAESGTLDTSKLKEIEMSDVTEEQKKNMPITYEAASLEDGLAALPFDITLPAELPFNAMPFQPPVINDLTHDGKKLMAEFRTFSENKDENIILMIKANYPVSDSQMPNSEEVELKSSVDGEYLGNALSFRRDDVNYDVVYVNKNISVEQHKEEIMQIANQIID